jgi:hypothetical protein
MDILLLGYSPIVADIDTVWTGNPLLTVTALAGFDVLITDDHGEVCGCFLYLNCTANTRAFWSRVLLEHDALVERARRSHRRLQSFADSEQKILTQLIYQRQYKAELKVYVLPPALFPSGFEFFNTATFDSVADPLHPVVVHNNFIVGKGVKRSRFERYGLWRSEDSDSSTKNTCDSLSASKLRCRASGVDRDPWSSAFSSTKNELLPTLFITAPAHNSVATGTSLVVQVLTERSTEEQGRGQLWLRVEPPTHILFSRHSVNEVQLSNGQLAQLTANLVSSNVNVFVTAACNTTVFAVDRGECNDCLST